VLAIDAEMAVESGGEVADADATVGGMLTQPVGAADD
jgi:hypothetical protein